MSRTFHRCLITNRLLRLALPALVVLLFVTVPAALAQEGVDFTSPDECAECHTEAYESWTHTLHANVSSRPEFIAAWAEADRPAYCRQCHGTGYDAATGEVAFEDVTCDACHTKVGDEPHPTADYTVDSSAELCGTCHSGVHSPTYEEWLLSDHGTMNIDCQTCHQPHDDGLRASDSNELCGRCHLESTDGSAHNIEGMECSFCHMYGAQQLSGPGEQTQGTGHTFDIPPDVCAACHGMTHTLTVDDVADEPQEIAEVAAAQEDEGASAESVEAEEPEEADAENLEQPTRDNFDLGLAGGGLGGLLIGASIVWLIRREKAE